MVGVTPTWVLMLLAILSAFVTAGGFGLALVAGVDAQGRGSAYVRWGLTACVLGFAAFLACALSLAARWLA